MACEICSCSLEYIYNIRADRVLTLCQDCFAEECPVNRPCWCCNTLSSAAYDYTVVFALLKRTVLVKLCSSKCYQSEDAYRRDLDMEYKQPSYIPCCYCGTYQLKMSRCGQCKVATYCSRNCQRSHWPLHRSTCAS